MARIKTFQRSLFANLAGNIILLGLPFLVLVALSFRFSAERMAIGLTGRALAETKAEFVLFLEPASSLVELSARHFSVSDMRLDDPGRLDRFFLPIIATIEQVSGATLAHEDGRSYALDRTATGWERRLSDPAAHPGRSRVSRWTTPDSEPVEAWEDLPYDARTRPWFTGAIAKSPDPGGDASSLREAVHLTRPYAFRSPARGRGVSASVSFRAPSGSLGVISVDLLLRDITDFIAGQSLEQSGEVALLYRDLERDEALLEGRDPGRARQEVLEGYLLAPPAGASEILLDFVAAALAVDPGDRLRPRRFESGGEHWWGATAVYDEEVLILAVFPEGELLAEFEDVTLSAIGLILLLLCLVVWRDSRLSRRYARPIEELADQTERMAGMNFHPSRSVETNIEEIQMLAQAQEQMRRSLEGVASRREDLLIARWLRGEAKISEGVPMGYELGLLDQPMEAVGGSVFETATRPDSPARLSLLLAVVPGEGVATAYEAGRLRSVFATGVELRTPLEEQTRLLHSHLAGKPELHASLGFCVAELDAAEATLAVLAEAACPALHFASANGRFHWVEPALVPQRIELAAGDTALLLTESVLRALSPIAKPSAASGWRRWCASTGERTPRPWRAASARRSTSSPAVPPPSATARS